MYGVGERIPLGTLLATTRVATLLAAVVESSSSQVMNRAERCAVKAGELRITGTACESQVSPDLIGQSCMLSHWLGVTQT